MVAPFSRRRLLIGALQRKEIEGKLGV